MKVLLIYPPFPFGAGMGAIMRSPPLSLMQLAGMIPDHQVEIIDLNANPNTRIADLEQRIKNVDIVGITCMSRMLNGALQICKIAKRHDVATVLGGFHPTLKPDLIKYPNIDYVVRGEGEYTFKELVDGVPPSEILGLSYKEDGGYHHNDQRPFIRDLDAIPFPRKDLVNYKNYHYLWQPTDVVESSRGCPFECTFCCVTKFYERTWRKKSPLRVIRELTTVPPKQRFIFFVDDNFTLNHKRVNQICDLIREYGFHKRLKFACQTRVTDIAQDPEMVRKMAKSGFVCFFIGFESLKQMSLDTMNKHVRLNSVKKAIKTCHDNGIFIFGSFIIGNIGETREDILRTLQLIKELQIDFTMCGPLTPYPGTTLWEEGVVNGWVDKDYDWATRMDNPLIRTPTLSADEIEDLFHYSYEYLYKGNYASSIKTIFRFLSPKFRWTWKLYPSFLLKGLQNFIMKVDTIVYNK